MARIHIPLITNPACVFICEGEDLYMEPGQAYMVWVNRWHQIRNDSDQDRYHIIMDAYDTRHVTDNFKYLGDIKQLDAFARQLRENINQTEITPEIVQKFENELNKHRTKSKHQAYDQ
jgi:3,4-dihydroxy-2-butanone 4-phosphate synthase